MIRCGTTFFFGLDPKRNKTLSEPTNLRESVSGTWSKTELCLFMFASDFGNTKQACAGRPEGSECFMRYQQIRNIFWP